MRLAAVNATAARRGLEPDLALSQAQAMLPDLVVRPYDAAADAHLLDAIADWADRYTPFVGLNAPDGLMLDITGAAHLLGGEAALQADMLTRLEAQGFSARIAIAATPGAAFALARYGPADDLGRGSIVSRHELRDALDRLSIAALRIDLATAAGLRRSGLKNIGDLMCRPRAPLAARFGATLLHRLDQALGIETEAISPRRPLPPAEVSLPLAEPILREEDVSEAARRLCVALCDMLIERREGARQVVLSVTRVDGVVRRVEIGTSEPVADPKMLHGLLALRLGSMEDPLDAGYGFDLVRIAATATAPRNLHAIPLPGTTTSTTDFATPDESVRFVGRLADRLAARFGQDRVETIEIADRHLPEQADTLVAQCATVAKKPSTPRRSGPHASVLCAFASAGPLWPIRMFEPPEPAEIMAMVPDGPPLRLRWRRQSLKISSAEGPERIAAPWWTTDTGNRSSSVRDYYRVIDESGRRLWIYRDGLFDGPMAPRWYVHGLFA